MHSFWTSVLAHNHYSENTVRKYCSNLIKYTPEQHIQVITYLWFISSLDVCSQLESSSPSDIPTVAL